MKMFSVEEFVLCTEVRGIVFIDLVVLEEFSHLGIAFGWSLRKLFLDG